MIDQPNASVALTFEQLQQIETAKDVLKGIETETSIAARNLGIVNKDVVKATKEREYQEELIAKYTAEAIEKKATVDSMSASIDAMATALGSARAEEERAKASTVAQNEDIQRREQAMSEAEEAMRQNKEVYRVEAEKQQDDRNAIETTVKALTDAINTWK